VECVESEDGESPLLSSGREGGVGLRCHSC
jgi:hypothetical protein